MASAEKRGSSESSKDDFDGCDLLVTRPEGVENELSFFMVSLKHWYSSKACSASPR